MSLQRCSLADLKGLGWKVILRHQYTTTLVSDRYYPLRLHPTHALINPTTFILHYYHRYHPAFIAITLTSDSIAHSSVQSFNRTITIIKLPVRPQSSYFQYRRSTGSSFHPFKTLPRQFIRYHIHTLIHIRLWIYCMLVSFHQEVACLDNISLWMLSISSPFPLWSSLH